MTGTASVAGTSPLVEALVGVLLRAVRENPEMAAAPEVLRAVAVLRSHNVIVIW